MTGLVVDNLNIAMTPLDIPGYVNEAHLEDLAKTISSLSDNAHILEIGCAYGRSTWCTLSNMKPTQTLTVVDTFIHLKPKKLIKGIRKAMQRGLVTLTETGAKNLQYLDRCNHQRQMFDHILDQHPLKHTVKVNQMTSQQYIAHNPTVEFDCVYIDGEHTYDAVSMELNQYKGSTILCGDDWGPAHPGVTRAINEFRSINSHRTWYGPDVHRSSGFWRMGN